MSKDEKESIIPDVIYDENAGKSYLKGRFFGKVCPLYILCHALFIPFLFLFLSFNLMLIMMLTLLEKFHYGQ